MVNTSLPIIDFPEYKLTINFVVYYAVISRSPLRPYSIDVFQLA